MKSKIINLMIFLFSAFSFYSCYHIYADYVDDIEISYNNGSYYLTWAPVKDAESYIVYVQTEYKNSEDKTETHLKVVAETTLTECTVSSSLIPYDCKVLRIAAVNSDGEKSYLSKEVSLEK